MLLIFIYGIVLFTKIVAGAEQCKDLSNHQNYHLLNLSSICGRTFNQQANSNRIAWGNTTELGDHPWMAVVSVFRGYDNGDVARRECTGTLITDQYVLTAANCFQFYKKPHSSVQVWLRVYQHQRLKIINCDLHKCSLPPKMVEVEEVVIHPGYNSDVIADFDADHYDNIALLRLRRKVKFEDFIKPICLPLSCDFRSFDFVGSIAIMVGWDNIGVERTGLEKSALEQAQQMVFSMQSCQTQWEDLHVIKSSQLCASWPGGRGACYKDIGGPLLTETHLDGRQLYQIGIVSQGICDYGLRDIDRPNIFARVGDYIPFILDSVRP